MSILEVDAQEIVMSILEVDAQAGILKLQLAR